MTSARAVRLARQWRRQPVLRPAPTATAENSCWPSARGRRIALGEATQPTTNGRLVYHTLDGVVSFSDGIHTWVLDPSGQAQVRDVNERFPFEFNGDGLPVVGQPGPQINGPCPTAAVRVLAVENFYASLVNQIGGQCVSTST